MNDKYFCYSLQENYTISRCQYRACQSIVAIDKGRGYIRTKEASWTNKECLHSSNCGYMKAI